MNASDGSDTLVQRLLQASADLVVGIRHAPSAAALVVVRDALDREQGRDELAAWTLGGSVHAEAIRGRLAEDLASEIQSLANAVRWDAGRRDGPWPPIASVAGEGSMLLWDARFADWLEGHRAWGTRACSTAVGVREQASNRYVEYSNNGGGLSALFGGWIRRTPSDRYEYPAFTTIARILWRDHVQAEAKKERTRVLRSQPGLCIEVLDRIEPAFRDRLRVRETEDSALLLGAGDVLVASLDPSPPSIPLVDPEVILLGVMKLNSITAHRLLRYLVTESHRRMLIDHPDPRVISAAGWRGLAEAIGSRSKRDETALREIVSALDAMRFTLPDGSTARLIAAQYPPNPDRGSRQLVEITVATPLRPHYAIRPEVHDRRVVPLVQLPPMVGVGRPRDYGLLAALQIRVLAAMRKRASEAAKRKGVFLPADVWIQLAAPTGLSSRAALRARDGWVRDGEDAPAFLTEIETDRFALGPAHDEAWRFLLAGGKRSVGAQAAGLRSAVRKQQRRLARRKEK